MMLLIVSKPETCCYMGTCYALMCEIDLGAFRKTLEEEGCEYKWIETPMHVVVSIKRCRRYDWISEFRPFVSVVTEAHL